MSYLLEVCTETPDGAAAAARGGASRIELCSRLDLGGLTPDGETLRATSAAVELPVFAMVRPRGGDFVARPGEVDALERDLLECLEAGADGLVLGLLTADRRPDTDSLERLLASAGKQVPITFHRAFDSVADRHEALEVLIELGFSRLLTTGGPERAWDGRDILAGLVEQAAGRLVVMPGGGVRSDHADELARLTGAAELHGSVPFHPGGAR